MLDIDTEFRAKARKLKSPTSVGYDADAWQVAFVSTQDRTEADAHLLMAACSFASQSQALREAENLAADALSGCLSVILAIAAINREFLTVAELSRDAIAEAQGNGAVAFDHMVRQPLPGRQAGQHWSADDVIEIAVDAAESWLFDALNKPIDDTGAPKDLAPLAIKAMQRYSIQHGINSLWNQALWEGWQLSQQGDDLVWSPADRTITTVIEASRMRQEANFLNIPLIDMSSWATLLPKARKHLGLTRSVVEVVRSRGRRRIPVGAPSCRSRRPPLFVVERGLLEGSYLAPFIDRPFPKYARLTCSLVHRAWHVIHDLASALAKPLHHPTNLSESEARALSLLVGRHELLDTLTRALDVDESTAEALIQFLLFKVKGKGDKGHRGLWAAPLVTVPGEDRLALALPVLRASNSLRKAEAWLEKGGVDDTLSSDARGSVYEAEFRKQVGEELAGNPILTDARCAEHAIKKSADFGEEIDLLVQLGPLLIVGEVKCWLFPADSHERYNYFKKLKVASQQARNKAQLSRARSDVIARALSITEQRAKELRVVPLVITNQGFGFSLEVDGCRVTEAAFLRAYFGAGDIVTGMIMDPRSGRHALEETRLYASEAEAADRFEAVMSNPFVLRRFVNRIRWMRIPFPTASGSPFFVEAATLNDVSGAERHLAKAMSTLLTTDGA